VTVGAVMAVLGVGLGYAAARSNRPTTRTVAATAQQSMAGHSMAGHSMTEGSMSADPATEQSSTSTRQACTPNRRMTVYAERVGNHLGYGLSPRTASVPGPTISLTEGQCLAVTLVNHTSGKVGFHTHGLDYTTASDATPMTNSCTPAGGTKTYVFGTHKPTRRADGTTEPGSAGYWHYHDHCLGSPHGTVGIDQGLFGAIVVRRHGDKVPDRPPFVVVFTDSSINLKLFPDTPTFTARVGERVEFIVISHGNSLHTFHLHGHRWQNGARVIDNKSVGPGDSFGFQVIAGERVGPGDWMYHCHVQGHADGGMVGIFRVLPRA
jgi:FtsP/CotA-like multicopper oxidase with cupredoxin domain